MKGRQLLWTAGLILGLSLGRVQIQGAVISWTNTSGGSWSVAANWSPHIVPGSSDTVYITNAGSYSVVLDATVAVTTLTLGGASGQQILTNNNKTFSVTTALVTGGGVLDNAGGTLSGGVLVNQGIMDWSGGTIAVPTVVAPIGTLNFNGAVTLQAGLTNNGTVRWTGSGAISLSNNRTTYRGAIYNLAGGLFDIQNDRSVSYNYGYEFFWNEGTVVKSAGAGTTSFNVGFTNVGTVDAQSGVIQFANSGNIGGAYNTASGATIQFSSGGYVETGTTTNTGSGLFRQYGATVTINERISKFVLAYGNVILSPAFQGDGAIHNLQLDGAYLTGTNRVTGTLGINGGGLSASAALTVATGGALDLNGAGVTFYGSVTNNGTINWSGSSVSLANNGGTYTGAIYNRPGALFNIQTDQGVVSSGYGHELFVNSGTVRKSAGLGVSYFNMDFTNTGTVDAETGTLQFRGGGNLAGTYLAAAGAAVQFTSGTYTENGAVTIAGAGQCLQSGATVVLTDQIANFILASGNVVLAALFQGDGTIHSLQLDGAYLTGTNRVTGTLGFDGGGLSSAASLTVATNGVVNFNGANVYVYAPVICAGTVNWSSGAIILNNNSNTYTGCLILQPTGLLNILCDQSLSSAGYGYEFVSNAGTIRKLAGLGTTSIGAAATNSGLVDVQSGAIHFTGSGTLSGSFNTALGAVTEFDGGTWVQTGTMTVTGGGTCRQNGAAVKLIGRIANFLHASGNVYLLPAFQGDGTIHDLQLDGASLVGTNRVTGTLGLDGGSLPSASPLTVAAGGTLNFNGNNVYVYSPLTNNGTMNWSSGSLILANNAGSYTGILCNQAGGLFNLLCDQGISSSGYGFEQFVNVGTVRKTAGLGTTTLSLAFVNTGTLDVQSGIFRIAGPYSQTGGKMNFGITSLAFFGRIAFASSATFTGTLGVNFNGDYAPSAGDAFALVTYTSRSGAFDSLALPSEAQWQTNYSSTTFTLSVVGQGTQPVILTPVSYVAGNYTFQVSGPAGQPYLVWASTDLNSWTRLATNVPAAMPFSFTDTNAALLGRRFYRVQAGF